MAPSISRKGSCKIVESSDRRYMTFTFSSRLSVSPSRGNLIKMPSHRTIVDIIFEHQFARSAFTFNYMYMHAY